MVTFSCVQLFGCVYIAVCSRRRCELTASDEFKMPLCGVSETKCLFVSVSPDIHDVIHRRHTNTAVIGDTLDTLGTCKNKVSEWQLHNKHRVGHIWCCCVAEVLGEKVDWKRVLLIDTRLPETNDYIHLVVTKRPVVWWVITDSAKERIAVIPMCPVVQQQRQKKMGFSETSGSSEKTGSSITPLWDSTVRITQQTGSAHGP